MPVATIDEMVRRILRPVVGLQTGGAASADPPRPRAGAWFGALGIAEQCIVLLKNDHGLLPLRRALCSRSPSIGPDADNVAAAGGGSGFVQPAYAVSVLDGMRQRGDNVRVDYAAGVDPIGAGALLPGLPAVPSAYLAPNAQEPAGSGLLVEYWDNPELCRRTDRGAHRAARLN